MAFPFSELSNNGLLVSSIIKILPAYIANSIPSILSKYNVLGLKRPIDGGRKFSDGKRILGDGKTWQGLIFGTLVGTLIGGLYLPLFLAFLLSFGAILGDMVGSFLKRRLGYKRGSEVWLLDSWDFLIGALALSMLFYPSYWNLAEIGVLLLLTPLVHRGSNVLGYLLKLKSVPW